MRVSNKGNKSRTEERVPASLQASIDNTNCLTRDISATGVYLESSAKFALGELIDFTIDLESPGGKLIVKCKGKVVRVEKREGKVGVAVKIEDSVIHSAH